MANNKRIQILRGRNIKDNTTELMAGQPVYDTEKNILRVGKGGETIANTKPLNLEGNAVLGTTTGTTNTTDRQPDHIFEENSNTVKQATNATNAENSNTVNGILTESSLSIEVKADGGKSTIKFSW